MATAVPIGRAQATEYRIRPREAGVTEFEKMEYNRLRFDGQRGNLVFSMSGGDKVEKVMCADTAIPPNYSLDCLLHAYFPSFFLFLQIQVSYTILFQAQYLGYYGHINVFLQTLILLYWFT